jgi:hypothetical protein
MATTVLTGATRFVVLTRRWAIKLPRLVSWRLFLCGLLANMQEREFSRTGWPELCPVLFSLPGGWLVVMPRAEPLEDGEWALLDIMGTREQWADRGEYVVPVEMKRDSFGWLPDRGIVAVDYGS